MYRNTILCTAHGFGREQPLLCVGASVDCCLGGCQGGTLHDGLSCTRARASILLTLMLRRSGRHASLGRRCVASVAVLACAVYGA
jgi:hypothetical protein